MSAEPNWMQEARKHDGLKEIPGQKTNPIIYGWLSRLKAWWSDDETPWCGTFVAHCMKSAGHEPPKYWMRAKAWADWGRPIDYPVPGCIAVFERNGGGHVGFVVGQSDGGLLMVLGGNQGNQVSTAPIAETRAIAYVWPAGVPVPIAPLVYMDRGGKLASENEA
jgi:uncharacterized protein (TIGR02594 family)